MSRDSGSVQKKPERRWARRREERPAEIVAAALVCFASRGFAATKLEEVATQAGVTKGTLYLYFPNKVELFKAVVRQSLVPHLGRMMEELEGRHADPAERIRRLVGFIAEEMVHTPMAAIPKLIITEAENFPELARFYLDEVIRRVRDFMEAAIRKGVEEGRFRPVDPRHAFFSVVSPMILATLWQRSLGPHDDRPLDVSALIREHLEIALRGLAAETSVAPRGEEVRSP